MMQSDLVIIGAGAAGLMAGASAGEAGLRAVILERRHRPGLKLLMCGNNRCNITHDVSAGELLAAYGDPVGPFLQRAVEHLPPRLLRTWFECHGLATVAHADQRVFPRSERADDVLHCFTDRLRDLAVPLVLNCAVAEVTLNSDSVLVKAPGLTLQAPRVLMATGGVSYPKTGSVGDGQTFAKALGHRIEPYRPGLAGIELGMHWLERSHDVSFPATRVRILENGRPVAETSGEILCSKACARGPAMVDASRIMARQELKHPRFDIDLHPDKSEEALGRELDQARGRAGGDWIRALGKGFMDARVAGDFYGNVIRPRCQTPCGGTDVARVLKSWCLTPVRVRPLKEAMVTVGGVRLEEIDPDTMRSRRCSHVWFAGEVMDIDGPTGGYNLHAAFATARLAVADIAQQQGRALPAPKPRTGKPRTRGQKRGRGKRSHRRRR